MAEPAGPVLLVLGTRPEAIKVGPVYREFVRRRLRRRMRLVVTGQHRDLVVPMLSFFGMEPDYDLNLMTRDQSLTHTTVAVLRGMERILKELRPAWVVVQGDTTSAMAAALAAHYAKIPVAHIEAGLRSGSLWSPYPEEYNRRAISALASLHFAPTGASRSRLLAEGHPSDSVLLTGNTSIDALFWVLKRKGGRRAAAPLRTILVTAHRRENHGPALEGLCEALRRIRDEFGDVRILYPVHPNPNVRDVVFGRLGGLDRVSLVEPLDYPAFVSAMAESTFIVSDSGGVQEEAPALGKPVLVFRDTTERPEAVEAGVAELVGTAPEALYLAMKRLLTDRGHCRRMSRGGSPFGDGKAAGRIVDKLLSWAEGK